MFELFEAASMFHIIVVSSTVHLTPDWAPLPGVRTRPESGAARGASPAEQVACTSSVASPPRRRCVLFGCGRGLRTCMWRLTQWMMNPYGLSGLLTQWTLFMWRFMNPTSNPLGPVESNIMVAIILDFGWSSSMWPRIQHLIQHPGPVDQWMMARLQAHISKRAMFWLTDCYGSVRTLAPPLA